jgi:subtilisin family serine protease
MKKLKLIGLLILLGFSGNLQAQNEKVIVKSQADLPRLTYKVDILPSEFLTADEPYRKLVAAYKKDILDIMEKYTIEDTSTLKGYYSDLSAIALMESDYSQLRKYDEIIKNLETKPSAKLMSGIFDNALIASDSARENKTDLFRENLKSSVTKLPWEIVGDEVKSAKATFEILSENLIIGMLKSQYDPSANKTGIISGEVARAIIGARITIEKTLPYKNIIVEVLRNYIDKNKVEKKNIWADRDVPLSGQKNLKTVVIGIWDTGVDSAVYKSLMFQNKNETFDGIDNDQNGYIDDINGIAYDLQYYKTTGVLYPLDGNQRRRYPEMISQMKGFLDLQSNIESTEATDLKQKMSNLKQEDVSSFIEELSLYSNYAHGTHVAGIASAGNPAARILVVRETYDYKIIPKPPNKADDERWAKNCMDIINYFKEHGVRVVNMSWGWTQKDIESALEANGIGENSEERAKLGNEIFNIDYNGLSDAIKSAPGILFVIAAGNSNNDVDFVKDLPAGLGLPNIIVAGAVDQAGDFTSFTSTGRSVDVYSDGFEVESYVPGGIRMKFSGTSMSAPAVVNLAAKLIALDPSLTPEKVKDLIKKGADISPDGERLLINPKKTIELIKKQDH